MPCSCFTRKVVRRSLIFSARLHLPRPTCPPPLQRVRALVPDQGRPCTCVPPPLPLGVLPPARLSPVPQPEFLPFTRHPAQHPHLCSNTSRFKTPAGTTLFCPSHSLVIFPSSIVFEAPLNALPRGPVLFSRWPLAGPGWPPSLYGHLCQITWPHLFSLN